jgi:HK97 family phage prohead protease
VSGETQYRSYRPDLEVRSSGDGRTICGIVVPYLAPTRINDALVEQFARGAFNHQLRSPSRVKLSREHYLLGGEIIGAGSLMRDDASGLYMELRASKTPRGDETLELVRDGALSELSIMFRSRQDRRLAGGITERVTADMSEVAVVMEGAYGELAAVSGVRSAAAGVGRSLSAEEAELRAAAEQYLTDGGLPALPDHEVAIRALRLGLRF